MVEPVARLLIGRGHPVIRARTAGLADDEDIVISDFAMEHDLIVVTFDHHFRRAAVHRGCRCLHILPPERTARTRLADAYREIADRFYAGERMVKVLPDGSLG
jgi:Domain of unknown function (DUF5615)